MPVERLKVYGAPIEHAPSVFRAELGGWVRFGRVPDNELLAAIIRNDLGRAIALTNETSWPLVRDTMRWLWAFYPHHWTPGTDFTECERQIGQLRGENAELKAEMAKLRGGMGGMTTLDELRDQLALAEQEYACAEMIDETARQQQERARWGAEIERLRAEIGIRGETRRIERHAIPPGMRLHPLRARDLTASDIGAAVGVDPWRSPLRVYAEKAGEIRADGETNIMRRGRWLETAALEALREELPGWRIERANVYLRDPEVRLGATPDALAEDPEHPERLINVQIKTVARPTYERDWADDRTPLNYVLQTLAEGFLLDADRSLLVALVIDTYSADVVVREIARHAGAEQRIRQIAAAFWQDIAAGRRPAPDYGKDAETIAAMFPPQPEMAPLDLGTDNRMLALLDERRDLKIEQKDCEEDLAAIDAEIVDKLKGATSATAGEWRITRKLEERKAYTVAASSRAVLRIRQVEEKEKAA